MVLCFVFSDFVFVQGTGAIFKVALCLLSNHEGEIVECDTFESIVDYLKTTLPALTQTQMEQTIAKVQSGKFKKVWNTVQGFQVIGDNDSCQLNICSWVAT